MVFQQYALFPHLNVFDNIGFELRVKHVPKAEITRRVGEMLEMVRLPNMEKRKPAQLSGGQRQRVALARSLINHPGLLLLDEPLGALDQKLRKEMQVELKSIQQHVGVTFVYVTHDQEEALTMSDRIAVMSGGRVLQVGPAFEIYERPNCRFVADFIGESNFLDATVQDVQGPTATVTLTGGLTVYANTDLSLTRGQAVTVAVRPEKVGLRPYEGAQNAFPGRVEEIVYIGTYTHYSVMLNGDQRLRVREQNEDPYSRPLANPGDAVTVYFDQAAARVLTE